MKKDFFLNAAVGIMAICALLITSLVVRREFSAPAAPVSASAPSAVADWEQFATRGLRIGPPDAKVTIVEFSDFQCPFCRVYAEELERLRQAHPRDIAIVYRHFPLRSIHPHAEDAALASECAGAQGRFPAFHDALYARQDSIGDTGWASFARAAGVPDSVAFHACVRDRTHQSRIEEDGEAARKLGVASTPTSVINGKKYIGVLRRAELDRIVNEAIAPSAARQRR